jgi:hypothetical protein
MVNVTLNNIANAALGYAEQGWPVFPCRSSGKVPLTPAGFKSASVEPDQIIRWWEAHPLANIGTPTGTMSGYDVLDVDVGSAIDDLPPLPDTVQSITGSGGQHHFFKHRDGLRNSAGRLAHGVDIRGDGGYVILPPSVHVNGNRYLWELSSDPAEVEVAPWPDAYGPLLLQTHAPSAAVDPGFRKIQQGHRNDELLSLAGTLRHLGMEEAEIVALLQITNQTRCDPPLETNEIATLTRQVLKYGVGGALVRRFKIDEQRQAAQQERVEETAVETLPFQTGADLYYKDLSLDWLVEPLLPAQGLVMFSADPQSGKTWLGLDLALAAVSASQWLGRYALDQTGVLLWDEESSEPSLKERLNKLGTGRAWDEPMVRASLGQMGILGAMGASILDPTMRSTLSALIARERPGLVIIDSLVRIHDGDENAAQEMKVVLGILKQWTIEYHLCLVFIHHNTKPSAQYEHRPDAAYRGSSDIAAAVDTHLAISSTPQKDGVLTIEAFQAKHRLSPRPMDPFRVQVVDTSATATTVLLDQTYTDTEVQKSAVAEEAILQRLAEEPLPGPALKGQILTIDGVTERTYKRALSALQKRGAVVSAVDHTAGTGHQRIYTVTGENDHGFITIHNPNNA